MIDLNTLQYRLERHVDNLGYRIMDKVVIGYKCNKCGRKLNLRRGYKYIPRKDIFLCWRCGKPRKSKMRTLVIGIHNAIIDDKFPEKPNKPSLKGELSI